jgi:hypothetical protein
MLLFLKSESSLLNGGTNLSGNIFTHAIVNLEEVSAESVLNVLATLA